MQDLRSFLHDLRGKDRLVEIGDHVSARYEIPGIIAGFDGHDSSPTILFKHVRRSPMRVISNLLASRSNAALALGTQEKYLISEIIKRENRMLRPKYVESGPVKERVLVGKEVDLRKLPLVTHYERDDGPCITGGLMLMKDPESHAHNVGCYRLKPVGKNTLAADMASFHHASSIVQEARSKKQKLPVAIFIGHHPALLLGALSVTDRHEDEMCKASSFLRDNLAVTRCETQDLNVPARSEIVLEGFIDPLRTMTIGPFAESARLYGEKKTAPVVRVTAITMREDAVYHEVLPGYAEHHLWNGLLRTAYLLRKLKQTSYSVRNLDVSAWGACNTVCVVSVPKARVKSTRSLLRRIFEIGAARGFLEYCIAVDEDVDIYSPGSVLWAVATRASPRDSIVEVRTLKEQPKCGVDATLKGSWRHRASIPVVRKATGRFSD